MSRGNFIYFGEEGASLFLRYELRLAEREPGLAVVGELGLGVDQDLFHGGDFDLIAMFGEHLSQFRIDHDLIGDLLDKLVFVADAWIAFCMIPEGGLAGGKG